MVRAEPLSKRSRRGTFLLRRSSGSRCPGPPRFATFFSDSPKTLTELRKRWRGCEGGLCAREKEGYDQGSTEDGTGVWRGGRLLRAATGGGRTKAFAAEDSSASFFYLAARETGFARVQEKWSARVPVAACPGQKHRNAGPIFRCARRSSLSPPPAGHGFSPPRDSGCGPKFSTQRL